MLALLAVYAINECMAKKTPLKFKIESGIPIHPRKWHGTNIYEDTLRKMLRKQSTFWAGISSHKVHSTFGRAARALDMKITTRKEDGGVRIWRVK